MSRSIKAHAATKDIDALWKRVHKTRQNTKTVSVPRGALERMLLDYGRLAAYAGYDYRATDEQATMKENR